MTGACPSCGTQVALDLRFCTACGRELPDPGALPAAGGAERTTPPERRLVSVLFADLVNFTTLAESLDPEEVWAIQSRYFEVGRRVIASHGGNVEKFIGDAIMAVWGAPVAHEDDAARAARAALELVRAIGNIGGPAGGSLMARAGVMTGEAAVTVGARGQGMVSGDLVNAASRLQTAAQPGEVLVDEATMRSAPSVAFAAAGSFKLKGRSVELAAWRAIGAAAVDRGTDEHRGRFVGREAELAQLLAAAESVRANRGSRLVTVLGVAGVGKTRLAWELRARAATGADALAWAVGRVPAYGERTTFAPIADLVRQIAGLNPDADADRVAGGAAPQLADRLKDMIASDAEREWIKPRLSVLLSPEPGSRYERDELFAAWRRFFEVAAQSAPTVLVLEDLQWGDTSLLDFIEYLALWARHSALLVIAVARPDLLEQRPDWATRVPDSATIHLNPLPDAAMRELLADVAPGLSRDAGDHILERASGVPLYAVEVVRTLVDRGQLVRLDEGGFRLVEGMGEIALPNSLRGLIAARIDGLPPDERRTLRSAAVLGDDFRADALEAISRLPRDSLRPRLEALLGRELLTARGDKLAFVQDLVREVAYRTLSRTERHTQHLAAADYLASLADEELVEAIARHLVEAYQAQPSAPDAGPISARARSALRVAATRALSLHASSRALHHLEDALALSPDVEARAALLEQAATAARLAARFDRAEAWLGELIAYHQAHGRGTEVARATAQLASLWLMQSSNERALAQLEGALREVGDLDVEPATAELAGQLARARLLVGDDQAALEWADRTISAAERLGEVGIATDSLVTRGTARFRLGVQAQGRADLEQAVADAADHALLGTELRARNNLAWLAVSDDPRGTLGTARHGMELANSMGVGDMALQLADIASLAAVDTGDWRWALDTLRELEQQPGLALSYRLDFATNSTILRALVGDPRPDAPITALEPIDEATDPQLLAGIDYARAWVAFLDRRHAEAANLAARAAAREPPTGVERHFAQVLATRSELWLDDAAAVEAGLAAIDQLPVRGRFVSATRATLAAGLAALRGEDAAAAYRAAETQWRSLDLPFHLGLCLLERHRASGQAGPLRRARGILKGLGAEGVLRHVAAAPLRV